MTDVYGMVDVLADDGRWDDLLAFAAAPEGAAADRMHVAHVVALEAPPPFAAAAAQLFPDDERGFTGPLWEVLASRNDWRTLDPHLTLHRVRRLVAHTRVLHGEDLSALELDPLDPRNPRDPLDPPLRLLEWEAARWDPEWDLWTYDRTGCSGCTIWAYPGRLIPPVPSPVTALEPVEHPAVALLDGFSTAVRAHAVRGPVPTAVRATFADAYPHLVQLATGERAYERGTGHARARIAVWRALVAMAGAGAGSAVGSDAGSAVGDLVERLRCVAWRQPDDEMYHLRLAMEDPARGIAWVLSGSDRD